MNLFYESLPDTVSVDGRDIGILTDFREYVRLLDMLKDEEVSNTERLCFIKGYFFEDVVIDESAIKALTDFTVMDSIDTAGVGERKKARNLFSYEIDYPYILSGFMHDYKIDIESIQYLHWWKFRMLFDGLSEKTEIKQRIMYRGIDLGDIKDRDERSRIKRIQEAVYIPTEHITDYDIGDAFM